MFFSLETSFCWEKNPKLGENLNNKKTSTKLKFRFFDFSIFPIFRFFQLFNFFDFSIFRFFRFFRFFDFPIFYIFEILRFWKFEILQRNLKKVFCFVKIPPGLGWGEGWGTRILQIRQCSVIMQRYRGSGP